MYVYVLKSKLGYFAIPIFTTKLRDAIRFNTLEESQIVAERLANGFGVEWSVIKLAANKVVQRDSDGFIFRGEHENGYLKTESESEPNFYDLHQAEAMAEHLNKYTKGTWHVKIYRN